MQSFEERLRYYFSEMLVYKNPQNTKFFSALSLPSYLRDWLVARFADDDGSIDTEAVAEYVKSTIPRKEEWKGIMFDIVNNFRRARFLAKIKLDLDVATRQSFFSLPDFGVPRKKKEAVADSDVVEKHRKFLLSPNEVWGIVTIESALSDDGKSNVLKLTDFSPFCPYEIDLIHYCQVRQQFTIEEWMDIVLAAVDYNPAGFSHSREKLTMISRLLPFVEKRINLIELAPKGTGKSYLFSQISKYGWLVSGGSISRARMFYNIATDTPGLASHYDYVAFDEIQSIKFTDKNEMQGALKGYLESGEYRVGDHHGVGDSGLILLGNIDIKLMNEYANMFVSLPDVFHESALIDRFHGFIKGWDIPRMRESMKARGWALNSEYFSEIMHELRGELIYRAVVEQLLDIPKNADTRDTEAIVRLCSGYLKLLFPHVRRVQDMDLKEFDTYCLQPAKEMRGIIKAQLGMIDAEFRSKPLPDITLRGAVC